MKKALFKKNLKSMVMVVELYSLVYKLVENREQRVRIIMKLRLSPSAPEISKLYF